jgi:large subunit ribosomal protein L29
MKIKEIKKLSTDQINTKIISFKKDLFNLRFKKVNGQMQDTAKVNTIKKNVAKLLTTLNNDNKNKNEQKNTKR